MNLIITRTTGFDGDDCELDAYLDEINKAHGFEDDEDLKLTRQNFIENDGERFFQKLIQNRYFSLLSDTVNPQFLRFFPSTLGKFGQNNIRKLVSYCTNQVCMYILTWIQLDPDFDKSFQRMKLKVYFLTKVKKY